MRIRSSGSIVTLAIAVAALSAAISLPLAQTSAQAPLKTAWGEPDLQGIWTDEFDTPFQRPTRYGTQEFLTQAQREEMDKQRTAHFGDDPRQTRGSSVDVGGAYNTTFLTVKRTASASPATGSAKAHALEEKTLIDLAFGFDS